jgi:hypothetical protein
MTTQQQALPALGQGEEYELRVADDPVYNVDDEREAAIVRWRLDCFERAGMESLAATALAVRRDVDRVSVERMLSAGASASQITAIVL